LPNVTLTDEDVVALRSYFNDSVHPDNFAEWWNTFKTEWYGKEHIAKLETIFKKLGILE
jgi:hypothetical protein